MLQISDAEPLNYRNEWNKRLGYFLNFSVFTWALIHYLIKFRENRNDKEIYLIAVAFSLSFLSKTHIDAVSQISIQKNCFTSIRLF